MERFKELQLKFSNLKFNKKFQVNKQKLTNRTKLQSFEFRQYDFEYPRILKELEKYKESYPQFDKLYLFQDRNSLNLALELFGEMLETEQQYKERIESETEQREYFDLIIERDKQQMEDMERQQYLQLKRRFEPI